MPDRIILPNEVLLSRAVEVVEQGRIAIIPVKGRSMDPFIRGNKDCVELFPFTDLEVGDVVLAEVSPGHYLLHRIFAFDGTEGVVLMGDGNICNTEYCLRKNVKARALVVISPSGKRKRLDSRSMKVASSLWRKLLPVRGILLRIFHRIFS